MDVIERLMAFVKRTPTWRTMTTKAIGEAIDCHPDRIGQVVRSKLNMTLTEFRGARLPRGNSRGVEERRRRMKEWVLSRRERRRRFTLQELAKAFKVHTSTANRDYKAIFGVTFRYDGRNVSGELVSKSVRSNLRDAMDALRGKPDGWTMRDLEKESGIPYEQLTTYCLRVFGRRPSKMKGFRKLPSGKSVAKKKLPVVKDPEDSKMNPVRIVKRHGGSDRPEWRGKKLAMKYPKWKLDAMHERGEITDAEMAGVRAVYEHGEY